MKRCIMLLAFQFHYSIYDKLHQNIYNKTHYYFINALFSKQTQCFKWAFEHTSL